MFTRFARRALSASVVLCLPGVTLAGTPAVDGLFVMSDSSSEIWQYELNGTYVPGAYPGSVGAPGPVFSNISQGLNAPYLSTYDENTGDIFVGNFGSGVTRIDGTTGALVTSWNPGGSSRALDTAIAPNGNVLASSVNGVDEYTPAGAFVQTLVPAALVPGSATDAIIEVAGNDVYVSAWQSDTVLKFDQFGVQDVSFGAALAGLQVQDVQFHDGELYVSHWYDIAIDFGVYKYDGASSFNLFADAGNFGPHGFDFAPNGELFMAMSGGSIERYSGVDGSHLGTFATSGNKLTDVNFRAGVPAPGGLAALAGAGLIALRRRR